MQTLRQRCEEFYCKSKCKNKVALSTFYQRCKKNQWSENWENIIWYYWYEWRDRNRVYKPTCEQWVVDAMYWYLEQPDPKPKKHIFRQRLTSWKYTKEQAMLMWEEFDELARSKATNPWKRVFNKPVEVRSPTPDSYYTIEISYDKQTANIIRKAYERELDVLEEELISNTEIYIIKELNEKISKLNKEIDIFNSYNQQ